MSDLPPAIEDSKHKTRSMTSVNDVTAQLRYILPFAQSF